jgi:hypothetical protein
MVCKYGCKYFWGNNLHSPQKPRLLLWFHPFILVRALQKPHRNANATCAETEAMLTYIGCRQRERQVVILCQSRGGLWQRSLFWLLAVECANLSQQFTDGRALTSGPNWTHSGATKSSSSSWFVSPSSYFNSSSWWSCCLPPPRGVFTPRRQVPVDTELSPPVHSSRHTQVEQAVD